MLSRKRSCEVASLTQLLLALTGSGLVIYAAGWPEGAPGRGIALTLVAWVAVAYGAAALAEVAFAERPLEFARQHWLTLALAGLVVATAWGESALSRWLGQALEGLSAREWLLVIVAAQQLVALSSRLGEAVPWIERHLFSRMSPGALLVATFALLSLGGAALLMAPNATVDGITFLDALFTSASAVCVTGLIVVDTATAFTPLGQLVVLILIQIGGLGIVTLTFFVALVGGQGVTVSSRVFLRDLINSDNLSRLGSAIAFIVGVTVICEAIGAVLIYESWNRNGVEGNLVWQAVFHSISAFCNAGFSLFSAGLAEPSVAGDWFALSVIMGLIIAGGIGFPILRELGGIDWRRIVRRSRTGRKRSSGLSSHSRLALATSIALIVGGVAALVAAQGADQEALGGSGALVALFQSVSARTAGFNIDDIGAVSHAGAAAMMLLMFIGGSPGGMAGGIKTTTMAVATLNLLRILRRRRDVVIFKRRVDESLCHRAFAVVLLSMLWIIASSFAIMIAQPNLDFLDTLFETVSAFATVGLSRGITAELGSAGKLVIILTMLVGRVGILNFFLSLLPSREQPRVRFPTGSIIVE